LAKAGVRSEMLLLEALAPYDECAARMAIKLPSGVPVFFVEEGIRDGGAGMLLGERLARLALARGERLSYHILAIDGHFAVPDASASLSAFCGIDGRAIAKTVAEVISDCGAWREL
jgi:hypothetical protein